MTASARLQNMSKLTLAGATGFLALLLYSATLAPTIGWGDSADLALRTVYDGDTTFVGTHRDYVLYRTFASLFEFLPIGDAGTRANFFTAFCGAITVGAVTYLTKIVTRNSAAAVVAGLALIISHTFWFLSVTAEVYTFNAALVFLAFALVAKWWQSRRPGFLYAAAALGGLSLEHHATGLVLAASVSPLLLPRLRKLLPYQLAISSVIFFAFSFGYWAEALPRLLSGEEVLRSLELDVPGNDNFKTAIGHELFMYAAYLTYNFLGLALPLGILGAVRAFNLRAIEILPPVIWSAMFVYAGITSSIPDKFNVYVLSYPTFAILVGFGVDALDKYIAPRKFLLGVVLAIVLMPPLGYVTAIWASTKLGIDLVHARQAPFRDNAWYFMWPSKYGDYGPRVFAETALHDAAPNSVLITDYTLWRPLYFIQAVEGVRPDVKLVFVERLLKDGVVAYIERLDCKIPVYLATDTPPEYYQLDQFQPPFSLSKNGILLSVAHTCNG